MAVAYITSTGEETSLTLETGNGIEVWTVGQAGSGWQAAAATTSAWQAGGPVSGWAAAGL